MSPSSSVARKIRVERAFKRYGEKIAVDGASLTLEPGTITGLLGPSGCGKSTLLRLIAGLEALDGGAITAGERTLSEPGRTVEPEDRDVGLVFQDYALFPHLSVEDNVAFGLKGRPRAERRARALAELERVRLSDRARSYPQTLSGGEQQRVALARALARDPAAVLMDEPFSGLDGRLKTEVRDATLAALRASGSAVLVVTHDAEEAMSMGDRIALMREGRILQVGTPQECYLAPVSVAAARLLGEADALPARVSGGVARTAFGAVPAEGVADGAATVCARPEAYRLSPAADGVRVEQVRFRGAVTELTLVAPDGTRAHAHAGSLDAPATGAAVSVDLDPRFCCVFAD